ncbi:MAG: class I SAM-dependent DNA methyltransferase [Pararhodobacter sp.]
MTDPDLSQAYALNGPDDCLRLYADWAHSYDDEFAAGMDYQLPAHTAAALRGMTLPEGPILDVGAGTGLLGVALRALGVQAPIDAVDLSPAMLERARQKGLYRALHIADITRPLPLHETYAGVVSSGTFTHGHVGPEGLAPLLAVARPGAGFALSVNAAVWRAKGFAEALDALGPAIGGLDLREVAIYGARGQRRDPAHADDRALLLRFHKT